MEAQSSDFHLWVEPCLERRPFSFRREAEAAAIRIDRIRRGQEVALCYSAGTDSELIAHLLSELGVPYTLYFVDLWGINKDAFIQWSAKTRSFGARLECLTVTRKKFYDDVALPLFQEFGLENPTYLALAHLISRIPSNQFVVTGDGDLHRQGPLYRKLRQKLGATGHSLPTSAGSVFLPLWSNRYRPHGEFGFFSSTPELLAAMHGHPTFRASFPEYSTSRVLHEEFPEIEPRPKTTNWDGNAYVESTFLREWLVRHTRQWTDWSYWRPDVGALLDLDALYLPTEKSLGPNSSS